MASSIYNLQSLLNLSTLLLRRCLTKIRALSGQPSHSAILATIFVIFTKASPSMGARKVPLAAETLPVHWNRRLSTLLTFLTITRGRALHGGSEAIQQIRFGELRKRSGKNAELELRSNSLND